jgi:N-acetylneuraminic acid mutarotase
MRKLIVLASILLFLTSLFADNKSTLTGTVVDATTGKPIFLVNVFLSYTSKGSITDYNGNFFINKIPPGAYTLVFHHIGYKLETVNVQFTKATSLKYDIKLSPRVIPGEQVEVVASTPKIWKKNLKIFKKEFIGRTKNAKFCKIINPEVLSFQRDFEKNVFTAEADSLLIIENKALGYRIKIVLDSFILKGELVSYRFYPLFQQMNSKDKWEKPKWEQNRNETYEGSFKHFLSCLYYTNYPFTKKFEIYRAYRTDENIVGNKWEDYPVDINSLQIHRFNDSREIKKFRFNDCLVVEYKKDMFRTLISLLDLSKEFALINENGNVLNANAILVSDSWAEHRIADTLPLEFRPQFVIPSELISRHQNDSIFYIESGKNCKLFDNLDPGRFGFAAVANQDNIYLTGGCWQQGNNITLYQSIDKYNVEEKYTLTLKKGISPRRFHTSEIHDGKIYLIGGETFEYRFYKKYFREEEIVECFNAKTMELDTLAPLPTPRKNPASILHNNKIYIVGGSKLTEVVKYKKDILYDRTYLNSVEIYDITTNIWTQGKNMPTARECDVVLKDGKIYAIGGFDSNNLNNFEVYDIQTNSWKILPDLPCVLDARCVLWKDKIFAFGEGVVRDFIYQFDFNTYEWTSFNSNFEQTKLNEVVNCSEKIFVLGLPTNVTNPSFLNVQYFEPSYECDYEIAAISPQIKTDYQFTTVAYLEPGRYGLAATVIEDDIYIMGGSSTDDSLYGGPLPFIEKYHIKENKFTRLTKNVLPRRFHTAESFEGKIYILGGVSLNKENRKISWKETNVFEVYTSDTNEINKLKKLPTPRKMPASVIFDAKIYVIGGTKIQSYERAREASVSNKTEEDFFNKTNIETIERSLKTVEIYDIKNYNWIKGAKMPTARACDVVLMDNKIYAIGGYNGFFSTKAFEVYDIFADRWEKLPDLPFPISSHHCETLNDKIYVFGDYQDLQRVCQYDFATGEWSLIESNFKPCRHSAVVKHKEKIFILGGVVASSGSYLSKKNGTIANKELLLPREIEVNIFKETLDVSSKDSYLSNVQVFKPGKN